MTRISLTAEEPATPTEFPNFRDGDVAVALTAARVYRLHSSVLKRNSKYFAEALREPGPKLNKQAREDGAAAYRLEYLRDQEGEGQIGFWIRKQVSERGRYDASSFVLPEIFNGKIMDPILRCWEWLFGIFYNKPPDFDDECLASLLSGGMMLIDVAENIGCADHVRKIVDLAILQQDKSLWSSISTSPGAWAELACRVHSQAIFKESICHLVGKWLMLTRNEKADLSDDIRSLCEAKFKELDTAKEAIEMRMLGHYPSFLYRDAKHKPGRPSYANDIYMWMALDFFRQWYAQNISSGNNRKAEDGGYSFYKQISLGGPAYLDHEDFRNFHQYFPMSSKACAVLERDMGVLKEDVKPFVEALMRRLVHLDDESHKAINWLTCTVVNKEDCPWVRKERAELQEAAAIQQEKDDRMFLEDVLMPNHYGEDTSIRNSRARDNSTSPAIQENTTPIVEMAGFRAYCTSDADQ